MVFTPILFLAVALAPTQDASADDKSALIEQVLKLTRAEEISEAGQVEGFKMGLEMAPTPIPADKKAKLIAAAKEIMDDIMPWSVMKKDFAQLYDKHYSSLKGILYRDDTPVLSIPDPEGARVGNGGAIGNTLLELKDRLEELSRDYPHLQGKSIEELIIVLIQAGGFGTRFTAGSSDGSKTLMPMPVVLPNGKQARMMDLVLMGSYKFTQMLKNSGRKGGLVVLNGDGLLITESKLIDGIALITNPETVLMACGKKGESKGKLGVIGMDNKNRILHFYEKPNRAQLEEIISQGEKGGLVNINPNDEATRQLQTNTASFVASHANQALYRRFLAAFLKINDMVKERLILKREGKDIDVYEIDSN